MSDYAEYYEHLIGDYYTRRRKARGRTRPVRPRHDHAWREIRERIFVRDDYTCRYCGTRGGALECDHVTPVARGGGDGDENLVTACRSCNRSKRDKSVEEWRACRG